MELGFNLATLAQGHVTCTSQQPRREQVESLLYCLNNYALVVVLPSFDLILLSHSDRKAILTQKTVLNLTNIMFSFYLILMFTVIRFQIKFFAFFKLK